MDFTLIQYQGLLRAFLQQGYQTVLPSESASHCESMSADGAPLPLGGAGGRLLPLPSGEGQGRGLLLLRHELAYLHPNRFTPDKTVLNELGVGENDKYVLLRFVSWNATHDAGHKGMSYENKLKAVEEFSKYAKVFISSEKELPDELKKYKLPTAPERVHDVMAFASMIFGESATMVSEGVVLGVPGIYMDNTGRYYTTEQEKRYGMCWNYTESEEDQQWAIAKGVEILSNGMDLSGYQRLMHDKIDVTAFIEQVVEEYVQ